MDASERLSELVEVLRRDGRVDVATAAAEFGTAELTIRRDLDVLVERGVARRVRGGAVNLLMRGEELPFAMRAIEAAGSKRRIAEAGAGLIADGEAVALDSGTTVTETGRALAPAGIRALRFDTVVLGCCGVSPEGDVMAHDLGDAAVKQALMASGGRSVLAGDGPLAELDVVVTDDTAPEPAVAALRAAGVEVHRA